MQSVIDSDYLAPERYDQYCGAYASIPDWFLAELSARREILELACGTGRIAIPLAQQGMNVTGIDYSKPMLDLAKSKAQTQKVHIDWMLGDVRSFELKKKFQAILMLSNALWHLHENSDVSRCLKRVRQHLFSDGLFVLDVFVPGIEHLNRDPKRRYPFANYLDDETGETVEVKETYRYEADTQMSHVVHYKENSDEIVDGLTLRMYFPKELDALLEYNGMKTDKKFGSWDREPFGPNSKHQLYFCSTLRNG
jgi:SAM-dependent methyltransferase